MKLTPALRLLVTTVLLLVGTALVWWLVGFIIGKGVLGETGGLAAFRRAYGFEERALVQLFALAFLAPVTRALWGSISAQARWPALAALALGAALVFGDKSGAAVGFAVFVVGAAAAAEAQGKVAPIGASLVAGAIAAFAFIAEMSIGTGEKVVVGALRAVFFFLPLLAGPAWIDRWLLDRLGRQ